MTNKQLIKDFEEKFKEIKIELKFKSTLKQLDENFFLKDMILSDRYISDVLSRRICRRILDTFNGWNNYLHSLMLPNPGNMMNVFESKVFDEQEKEEILKLMRKVLAHVSNNSLIGLTKDKKIVAEFLDYSVEFWNIEFCRKVV